ncbi:hypothetical protein [Glycomyces salinus]|uniref:hypothetical protein n=1 Tax=Glycomyces salinus TaxID=980294 RepID=UPI0018EE4291|nr:hypothetical protein [Glycomyces salinus]
MTAHSLSAEAIGAGQAAARLRSVLRWDAAACGALGVVMAAGAPLVEALLGLPVAWALPFGVYLLGCAVALLLVAGYPRLVAGQVAGVVVNNVVAAAALLALPFTGFVDLNAAGVGVMLAGAALVAVFVVLEEVGLRRLKAA